MQIDLKKAEQVRVKRAKLQLNKSQLASKLGINVRTLTKIENGDYKAPKRVYQSVIDWLLEDI